MDYKKLLKKAREKLPESAITRERFEIPKIRGHIQGNKTILTNLIQIADLFGRDPKHLLKYLLKELATPGDIKGTSVLLGRKISASMINEKVKKYADEFVLCPECGKPDTKIIKEGNFTFIKCLACGSKKSVKSGV